jgi:hypothetical protein
LTTKFIPGLPRLYELNKRAIKQNLNRSIKFEKWRQSEKVAIDTNFPIQFHMVHNDDHMRVQFTYNAKGSSLWLDMSMADFNSLPGVSI